MPVHSARHVSGQILALKGQLQYVLEAYGHVIEKQNRCIPVCMGWVA